MTRHMCIHAVYFVFYLYIYNALINIMNIYTVLLYISCVYHKNKYEYIKLIIVMYSYNKTRLGWRDPFWVFWLGIKVSLRNML